MCSDRTKKEKEHFIRFDYFIFFNRYDGGEGSEKKTLSYCVKLESLLEKRLLNANHTLSKFKNLKCICIYYTLFS